MAFPHINTKGTNMEVTGQLFSVLKERLDALEKFIPESETDLVCDVELEKLAGQHRGKIYRAEINLQVGGELFRAEATEENMEDAIFKAKNELKRELRRAGDKQRSLLKRGGQKLKELMRFGRP